MIIRIVDDSGEVHSCWDFQESLNLAGRIYFAWRIILNKNTTFNMKEGTIIRENGLEYKL